MKTCILCTVDGTKFDLPEAMYNSVQNFLANPGGQDFIVIADNEGTIITVMRSAISYLYDYIDSPADHGHNHGPDGSCDHQHGTHDHAEHEHHPHEHADHAHNHEKHGHAH